VQEEEKLKSNVECQGTATLDWDEKENARGEVVNKGEKDEETASL